MSSVPQPLMMLLCPRPVEVNFVDENMIRYIIYSRLTNRRTLACYQPITAVTWCKMLQPLNELGVSWFFRAWGGDCWRSAGDCVVLLYTDRTDGPLRRDPVRLFETTYILILYKISKTTTYSHILIGWRNITSHLKLRALSNVLPC